MKKSSIFFLLLSASSVFAGQYTQGAPDDIDGNRVYRIEGCVDINFMISEFGYTAPTLGRTDTQNHESIWICLNNEYILKNGVDFLKQIAKEGLEANCFETTFDDANKTIDFEIFKEGDSKEVVYKESGFTISLAGYRPIHSDGKTETYHLCAPDPSNADWFFEEILKQPLVKN